MTPRKPRDPDRRGLGTPDEYPVLTPPGMQAADHSWVLQTVMELQKTSGQLTHAVESLTETTKEHGKKLDLISHRIYAFMVVLTVLGGVLYFFLDRLWDKILTVLTALAKAA